MRLVVPIRMLRNSARGPPSTGRSAERRVFSIGDSVDNSYASAAIRTADATFALNRFLNIVAPGSKSLRRERDQTWKE
jgi:hypothetical protein